MNKLKNIWGNFTILMEGVIKYPKVSIVLLVTLLGTGYFFSSRVGGIYDCYKTAWYEQGVELENFEFKMLTQTCVVKRSDGRWIPVNKVLDVSEDIEE